MIWFTNIVALAIAVIGGLVFWFAGHYLQAVLWIAAIFAGFTVYHSHFAQSLQDWLISPQGKPVPAGHGVWGDILDRISRLVNGAQSAQTELTTEIGGFRAAVDLLPDALVVLDKNNVVQWSNRAAQHLYGVFEARRPIQHFIRQPDFNRYLDANDFEQPLRIELSTRPGRTFEMRLHDTAGEDRLLVGRDITEQAKLDNLRNTFVANVSHEIRTPITVINGFAETMLTLDLDEAKKQEYLENILKHSQTMQSLVEDLLVLSSLEASIDEVADERIDVAALFKSLAAEARELSVAQHTVQGECPEDIELLGSKKEIESAVRNLLTNAVRYTPKGGSIDINWSIREGDGWISVVDTGIGISAEHLPRLSERFYRVDRGRSRSTGGTGLGLAIVKHIANRHGATLNVESQPGMGSTFSLVFPGSRIRRAGQTVKTGER